MSIYHVKSKGSESTTIPFLYKLTIYCSIFKRTRNTEHVIQKRVTKTSLTLYNLNTAHQSCVMGKASQLLEPVQ